jgi:hypothetical protein
MQDGSRLPGQHVFRLPLWAVSQTAGAQRVQAQAALAAFENPPPVPSIPKSSQAQCADVNLQANMRNPAL